MGDAQRNACPTRTCQEWAGRPPPIGQARAKARARPHRRTRATKLTRNELHQRGGAERGVYAQTQRKAAKLSHPKAGASAPSSDSQVARVMRATKKGTRVFVRRGFAPPRSRDYPRRKGHGPIGLLGVSETRNPTLARAVLWQKPPHR